MDYTPKQIAAVLDYACLSPRMGNVQMSEEADICAQRGIVCFCCPSVHVKCAALFHPNVAATIGFPHGNSNPEAKYAEAVQAIKDGAKELDVVVNYGLAKMGDWTIIEDELGPICTEAHHNDVLVKAIIETSELDLIQLVALCRDCIKAEVDYVKTSTGFASGGATDWAVQALISETKGTGVKVKASGGIKTYQDVVKYLDMGCERLGTSRYIGLLPCETD